MDIRKYFISSPKTINLNETSWIIEGRIPNELQYVQNNFEELWNLHPKEYGKIKIYGNIINVPRWSQCYMRPYYYSGINHEAIPLPIEFQPYLEWANNLGYGEFNIALINFYGHGGHYIGRHSDNESEIVENSPIVSITLGATRTFRIRDKTSLEIVKDINLTDGAYLIMGGEMQKHYLHEIPKVAKAGRRINITFRQMI
jgi:alkylated DNA repair dioxygenase AlkB